jgi:hypothetical protein
MRAEMSEPDRSAASTTTVPPGEAGDDAVASGEILRARLVAGGALRDDQAVLGDLTVKAFVLGRIDVVNAPAEDGDGARGEAGGLGLAVNAEGEAGDGNEACAAKVSGHVTRDLAASGGGIAGANDGDGVRAGERQLAQNGEQGRRRVQRDKQLGELRFAAGDQARAAALRGGDLVFDGGGGRQFDTAPIGDASSDIR